MVTSNCLYGIIAGLTRVIYLLNWGLFSAQCENALIERVVMMDGPLGHEMAAESDGDDDGVGVGYGKARNDGYDGPAMDIGEVLIGQHCSDMFHGQVDALVAEYRPISPAFDSDVVVGGFHAGWFANGALFEPVVIAAEKRLGGELL